MTARGDIPPPPGFRAPPAPGEVRAPSAQPPVPAVPAVLEVELSASYIAADGQPTSTVTFRRPPGLGDLVGWLDESSPEALARSLDTLPFRPAWVVHVLRRCANVPKDAAERLPARDLITLGGALRPFVVGGSEAPTSPRSPAFMGGDPETSPS